MHCPSPSYTELHSPSHGPRTGVGQSFREYNAIFLRTVGEGSSGLLHFETDTTFILLRRLQMRLKNLKPSVGRLRHILLLVTTQTQVKLARTKCVSSAKSDRIQTHVWDMQDNRVCNSCRAAVPASRSTQQTFYKSCTRELAADLAGSKPKCFPQF